MAILNFTEPLVPELPATGLGTCYLRFRKGQSLTTGVTVYIDTNKNGVFDAGDTNVLTDISKSERVGGAGFALLLLSHVAARMR